MQEKLPDLCSKGNIYYITSEFPPVIGGSSVINRNLLSRFDPESYIVFASQANQKDSVELLDVNTNVRRVFKTYYFSKRANVLLNKLALKGVIKKILKQAVTDKPVAVVGSFPNYYALKIARDIAKKLQIPLIAYIHDTIAESRANNVLEKEAKILQDQVFDEASAIMVMSEGIRELYSRKYGIESIPLEHTYLEEIPADIKGGINPQAFWGGYIYSINLNSVRRILNTLSRAKIKTFLASSNTKESLENVNINTDNLEIGFFSNRKEYLENLSKYGILILAIDWADESRVHEDELSTIFPTKTPEYLATGNLIIVHCPGNYFLARFFKEHNCGIVITERSDEAIEKVLKEILADERGHEEIRRNALKTALMFRSDILSKKFNNIVNDVCNG